MASLRDWSSAGELRCLAGTRWGPAKPSRPGLYYGVPAGLVGKSVDDPTRSRRSCWDRRPWRQVCRTFYWRAPAVLT